MTKDEVLASMPSLVDTLTADELQLVAQHLTIRTYKKNEVFYTEGNTPVEFFCLMDGKVKIYKDGVGGRSQILRVVNAVDYFGFRAAFCDASYTTAAAAFEPSTVACIPMSVAKQIVQQNAKFAWCFIQRLASILGVSDERTVNLTQKHIRGRLAECILFIKENYGVEEDGCTLNISITREDMANLSNMTTSNAIRTLSLFAQENLVDVEGRKIKILAEDELRRISRIG